MGWKLQLLNSAVGRVGLSVAPKGAAWRLIEPEQLARFLTHFRVDCVFDVGANTGQYGRRLRDIGYKGLIISFEPNPDACAVLKENAANDPQWAIKEYALGRDGEARMFNVMADQQFSSLLEPDNSEVQTFEKANAIHRTLRVVPEPLRTAFPSLQSRYGFTRPFLKMDTQGYDVEIVKGAGEFIGEFVGLQSELGVQRLYKEAPTFTEALDYYRSLGFRLTTFVPNNAGHFPDLNEVDCIMYNARLAG